MPVLHRILSQRRRILEEVCRRRPDVVAFSIVSDRFPWAVDLARAIKARIETTILAGGIHVTGAPEQVLSYPEFDFGVRGEADGMIVPLVRSIEAGRPDLSLPNLVYRQKNRVRCNPLAPLIQDLDSLPFPDKEIFRRSSSFDSQDMYTIMASRGCPYACSFCNNSLIKKLYPGQKPVRFRSVENVIAELEQAVRRFHPKVIDFLDEVFASKMSWLEEFVPAYRERIGLPFIACTHPAVESEKRVSLMHKAGCRKVDMGVQTLSVRLRKEIANRPETTEQVAQAMKWYKEAGITLLAENIIGFPTETEEDIRTMISFYNRQQKATIKIFFLRYYPGTRILEMARDRGLLDSASGEPEGSRSIALGGSNTSRLTRQMYLLLQLLPLLPRRLVDRILENRWYRYFPTGIVDRFAFIVGRTINHRDPIAEAFMGRYERHYAHSLSRALKSLFSFGKEPIG